MQSILVPTVDVQHNATHRLNSEPFHGSLHQGGCNTSAPLLRYDKQLVDETSWTDLVFGSGFRLVVLRNEVPNRAVILMRKPDGVAGVL